MTGAEAVDFSAHVKSRDRHDAARVVEVCAPARLHLGFIDPSGTLGRRFGSIGLALDGPITRITARAAAEVHVAGPGAERARHYAERALAAAGLRTGIALTIHSVIPEHAGLGSGTQLALAVMRAIAGAYARPFDAATAATLTERGGRSGIGAAAFALGGFIVDGGRGVDTRIPPILSRLEFPTAWRMLLVLDAERQGLNGSAEPAAFANLAPMPAQQSGALAQRVLMQLLPAIAEADFAAASAALGAVQAALGAYFAPVQGDAYTSPRVARVAAWLAARGLLGIGQSSWGPTGFALLPDAATAAQVLVEARREFAGLTGLRFLVAQGRNAPASCREQPPPGPGPAPNRAGPP